MIAATVAFIGALVTGLLWPAYAAALLVFLTAPLLLGGVVPRGSGRAG